MRQAKRPFDVREEARQLALEYARERHATGDPEGAGEFRDLAKAIGRIRLHQPLNARD